jgi:hypothetical protein
MMMLDLRNTNALMFHNPRAANSTWSIAGMMERSAGSYVAQVTKAVSLS